VTAAGEPIAPTPFWATPAGFAAIALLLSLPWLIVAGRLGLLPDESYYALWSMYPSSGYFDHSPGIAWIIAAGRWVLGEGALPIRIVTNLLGLVTLVALYRLGVLLLADARVGAMAGFFYAVSPAAAISFAVATPDGLSTSLWTLTLWAIAEFARGGRRSWWLAAGCFAGLGLLSKYTNIMLAPGILLYLLTGGERRRWLGLWQVWAAAGLALLLFTPVLLWNAQHGWISFGFQLGRSSFTGEHGGPSLMPFLLFWVALALLLLPPAFGLIAGGAVARLRKIAPEGLDLPLWTSLPIVAFFAVHSFTNTANPNWLDPVFPPLMLAAGWAAVAMLGWSSAWAGRLLSALQIGLGALLLGVLAVSATLGEIPFVGQRAVVSYGRGWEGLATELAAVARANGAGWIDTETYLLGSMIGYAAHVAGADIPVEQSNQPHRYTYRPGLPPEAKALPHLLVREVRSERRPRAPEGMQTLGVLTRRDGAHVLGHYAVFLSRP
jgi:4-amino-4-deoxy-L-arabinose transferase-like glycosyltransferase